MEENFIAHLKTMFSNVHGVDFKEIEKIGTTNVQLMINSLNMPDHYLLDQIEKAETNLKMLQESNPYDVMQVTEDALYLAYLKTKQGNKKVTLTRLKTLYSTKVSKMTFKPSLPSLRNSLYFTPGDEVMVYVGNQNKEMLACDDNWVSANVLLCSDATDELPIVVFFKEKVWKEGSLDGRYMQLLTTSPFIFKTDEFVAIRELISSGSDTYFTNIFFKNCEISTRRYKITRINDTKKISDIILDNKVAMITKDKLKEKNESVISDVIEITKKHYLYVSQAEEMVKRMKSK